MIDTWPAVTAIVAMIGAAATTVVWVVKTETLSLRERLDGVDRQLQKIDEALATLSNYKSRLDVGDERLLAAGRRIDDLRRQFDKRFATG